jgi:hypothetical protein
MSKVIKSIVGLCLISASIGLAASPAKAESKAAQCKRFDQAMTVFGNQFLSVKRGPNRDYSEHVDRLLSTSERALKQFQAQKFSDPTMRGFQQTTLNVFVTVHNDTITVVEAVERRDRNATDRAYKQVLADLQPLQPLGKKYEAYCGRSK